MIEYSAFIYIHQTLIHGFIRFINFSTLFFRGDIFTEHCLPAAYVVTLRAMKPKRKVATVHSYDLFVGYQNGFLSHDKFNVINAATEATNIGEWVIRKFLKFSSL